MLLTVFPHSKQEISLLAEKTLQGKEKPLQLYVKAKALELFAKTLQESLYDACLALVEQGQTETFEDVKISLKKSEVYDFSKDKELQSLIQLEKEVKASIKARELVLKASTQPIDTTKTFSVTLAK